MSSLYAFWFLNHLLEKGELRRQLRELKDKGFSGVFPHPRDGLLTPYMSTEWFDAIRLIAHECQRLGLELWLYDEDPYPSGVAGGRVVYDREEFSCRYLEFHEHQVAMAAGELSVDLPAGCLLRAFAMPKGLPGEYLDVTSHCGLLRTTWHVMGRVTSGYYPPYSRMGRPHWRAMTGDTFWRVQCKLAPGEYTLVAVFEARGQANKWGVYTDLMNPDATDYFIQLTHERYRKELGPKLFRTVKGIFTDESKVVGTFPWTAALPGRFKQRTGLDLLDLLPHLKYGVNDSTHMVRNAYRRVVGELFREGYTRRLYRWCERNGIRSTGHLSPEEDPVGQQLMTPDLMNLAKDFQLPGTDLISSNIGTREFCIINIGQKLVASVARQQGRREVLCEALGVSGEDLGPARMKSTLDWLFVLGINKIVVHGQFYSLDGHRKREAPPSIFWQAPYWPHFAKLADYVQSIARVLKRGDRHCEVAVLYPTAYINAMLPDRRDEAEDYRQKLGELCFSLLGSQLDFDFVSEDDLLECRATRQGIRVGRATYKALVVPEVPMLERSVCRKLRRLAAAPGRVLVVNQMPQVLEDGSSPRLVHRLVSVDGLAYALEKRVKRLVLLPRANDVFAMTRCIGKQRWHFLFNAGPKRHVGEVCVQSRAWLVEGGDRARPLRASDAGTPVVDIPALAGVLLKEERVRPKTEAPGGWERVALRNWSARPVGDNALVLKDWRVGPSQGTIRTRVQLPMDYELPPAVRDKGEAWFAATFRVGSQPDKVKLVWDESSVLGGYEVFVNGGPVTTVQRERVYDNHNLTADIGPQLRGKALNEVRIHVTRQGNGGPKLIEPIRLCGQFAVGLASTPTGAARIDQTEGGWDAAECVSWADMGYPHYSGTMVYETDLAVPEPLPACARLEFDSVAEVAKVSLNRRDCGVVAWPPWRCDVTSALRPGRNRLRIEVANTSINLIEGVPSPSGLIGEVALCTRG